MKAKKDNKVYQITNVDKQRYLSEGYDIYNDDGEIAEYSPKKKIPYNEYIKLLKEIASLREKIKELEVGNQEPEGIKELKTTPETVAKSTEKKTGKKAEG